MVYWGLAGFVIFIVIIKIMKPYIIKKDHSISASAENAAGVQQAIAEFIREKNRAININIEEKEMNEPRGKFEIVLSFTICSEDEIANIIEVTVMNILRWFYKKGVYCGRVSIFPEGPEELIEIFKKRFEIKISSNNRFIEMGRTGCKITFNKDNSDSSEL